MREFFENEFSLGEFIAGLTIALMCCGVIWLAFAAVEVFSD